MHCRTYGRDGPLLIALHGGPGAPGYMAPVARGLADGFRVLEPFQRGSGGEELSVARHVADLRELIEEQCAGERPALLGHSWGAMLALATAAEHPGAVGPIVLVGCGTFDEVARARLQEVLDQRADRGLREQLDLLDGIAAPDERLRRQGELLVPAYSCELEGELELGPCDARAHAESWDDMLRLQAEGVYPTAFAAVESPCLMLHGAVDPHPGRLIRDSLAPHIPQLEYREWEHCGHYPWLERAVRGEFFREVREWLE